MIGFKTIAVFNYQHEIMVLKHILDQEEIHYFFENENIISIDPLASFAFGGIQLKVHPNDFEQVQEILDNLNPKLSIV
ncbi:DUF2007 domain-containing protein [Flavobacterium sp. HJJ]|uniref:DUF2007 domain-containing protein n=1 Tax=Flavobacterium sp. HJJ TaxID=2783792 RepID=UPI00188AAEF6|nr:DUF2007 domain-containing protein [Flavobacterium sp. HJJ]MBF4472784.1 DUF2007 domain-containing protein [Flavobacterium sp. HJJ]